MNNGNWFRWAVGGLLLALFLLTGAILYNFDSRISKSEAAQAVISVENAVLKESLSGMKVQLAQIKDTVDVIEKRTRFAAH